MVIQNALPDHAAFSQGFQNAQERGLRDAGHPLQIVQADSARSLDELQHLQTARERFNGFDLNLFHPSALHPVPVPLVWVSGTSRCRPTITKERSCRDLREPQQSGPI